MPTTEKEVKDSISIAQVGSGHGGPADLLPENRMITIDNQLEAADAYHRLLQDVIEPWLDSHGYLLIHPVMVKEIDVVVLKDGRRLDSHLSTKESDMKPITTVGEGLARYPYRTVEEQDEGGMTAEEIEQAQQEMQRGRDICGVLAAVEAGNARELIDTIGEVHAKKMLNTLARELEEPS